VRGDVLPQLPGSLRSIWGAASSDSAVPLRLAIAQQSLEWMDRPLEGAVRIDLEVRRRRPLSAGTMEGAVDGADGSGPSAASDGAGEGGTGTPAPLGNEAHGGPKDES